MGICLIGVVKSDRGIRFRLLNKTTCECRELSDEQVKRLMDKTEIEGLELLDESFRGTNGELHRYDIKSNRAIILYKYDGGYIIANNKGEVKSVTSDVAIGIANRHGFSNGKVVTKDSITYISAIKGNYETITIEKVGILYDRGNSKRVGNDSKTEEGKQGKIDSLRGKHSWSSDGGRKEWQRVESGNSKRDKIHDRLAEYKYTSNVEADKFKSYIESAKNNNPHGACLSSYDTNDYKDMNCISFDDGKAGLAIHDGDIVSVFKHPESTVKGFVKQALTSAILNGGNKLDCYSIGGALPNMYTTCGFIPVCKIRFNREFAPDGWNYERDGEPDIVFMAYCGDTIEDMVDKMGNYKLYSEYSDEEVPYIEDSNEECAYDRAVKVRDNYIKKNKTIKRPKGVFDVIKDFIHSK